MLPVLAACYYGGLVEEGRKWFHMMEELGLNAKIKQYGCIIDILGRVGHLEEAEELCCVEEHVCCRFEMGRCEDGEKHDEEEGSQERGGM